jgi:acyl-coenzyme A thioesterase PaaI-like protein
VFWNQKEHELVAVVWFGGAVSGWPGVAHGGAIATVMADKIALAASLVNGDDAAADAYPSEPTRLDLTYKKPTYANDFYVVRAKPRHVDSASLSAGHVQVHAQLETLDGTICVLVDGDVPVSEAKGTVKTAVKSLTPAKSWMGWTSRSDT